MLEQLKKDVCEIAKRAQREGLCKHKSGNFSARDLKTNLVVVTPTGVDREELTARDMVVMDMDMNVIENLSGLKPTSECLMHFTIYQTRPETVAVAHTHSIYATSFAVLAKPIPAIVYEVSNLGLTKARVPVAPYGLPGTPALSANLVEAAKEADCFLMERHGVVAFDAKSIYEAYLKASYLEDLAMLYYNALTANGGKEPVSFEQAELQKWEYPKTIKFPH